MGRRIILSILIIAVVSAFICGAAGRCFATKEEVVRLWKIRKTLETVVANQNQIIADLKSIKIELSSIKAGLPKK